MSTRDADPLPDHTAAPEEAVVDLRELQLRTGQAEHRRLVLRPAPYQQGGVGFSSREDVTTDVDLTAMTSGMSFRLRFEADLHGPCARCVEDAEVYVDADVHEVHDPSAEDIDLHSDFVDDEHARLDVAAWVQEAIGLAMPTQVLCRDDCAGLCPQCGINLNEGSCDCTVEVRDTRWDKLRELDLDDVDDAADDG